MGQNISRRCSIWLLAASLVAGCGQVIEVEAVVGPVYPSCQRLGDTARQIRSIRVEAVEWYSGEPGEIRRSECHQAIEGLSIEHPGDLLGWFEGQPELLAGLPTDVPVRIQVVGFSNDGCELSHDPPGPQICGLSQDTLSETAFEAGGEMRFAFSCYDNSPQLGAFGVCLGVGSGPDS